MGNSKFVQKYNTESDFKEFVDTINENLGHNKFLMNFGYKLYIKYGIDNMEASKNILNNDILNIDVLISYFNEQSEYEKCQMLIDIKNKNSKC